MGEHKFMILGALVAAVVLMVMVKKKDVVVDAAAELGELAGGAVVAAASGAVAGVAYGIGDAVGVPRTNKTECQKAIEEGRSWDASFACPAGDFLSYMNPFK